MKRIIIFTIFIFNVYSFSYAATLGKIIQILGDVDITSFSSGKKMTPEIGTEITEDHRIRTGKKSFVELLLNDGTKLFVREISVLNVLSLKLKDPDPPTKIKVLTGKIRITVKKLFKDRSLLLKTATAIAAVRGTDFGVIAGKFETKLVVFEGKLEVANENKDILKSYILQEKEEASVKKDTPPTKPIVVPAEMLNSWFDFYEIDEQSKNIIFKKKDDSLIDNILRKKDF